MIYDLFLIESHSMVLLSLISVIFIKLLGLRWLEVRIKL